MDAVADARMPSRADFLDKVPECDLVMKGGITSGVVYPRAVCELARKFRLRSVGGTSAGAIAAAAAAAAECGRDSTRGGFPYLWRIPDWLGADDNLFRLFQPQTSTAALFAVVTAPLRGGGGAFRCGQRVVLAICRHYRFSLLLGACPGALLMLAVALRPGPPELRVLGALAALFILLTGAVLLVASQLHRSLRRDTVTNGYGLCSGAQPVGSEREALTPWLTRVLDELADIDDKRHPLTFRDLEARDVELVVLTTNLTHGAPYRIPFDTNIFYFSPSEFSDLFPTAVVRWMEEKGKEVLEGRPRIQVPDGTDLLPLPQAKDLPVVVAVRMSLSFPILLSAIPLWAYDYRQDPPEIQRNWFSDGGVCSNFPLHFFDAALPIRPTFGINLRPVSLLREEECDNAQMGKITGDITPRWTRFDGLTGFIGALLDTMQNWGDNALLRVPGYRDRVAHVDYTSDEGGLNLDMPADVIARMVERGRCAGLKLTDEFDWTNHRWTRYRSTMGVLEEFVEGFRQNWEDAPSLTAPRYLDLVERTENDPKTSYMADWTGPMSQFAKSTTEDVVALAESWLGSAKSFRTTKGPNPRPILRITPDV